MAGMNRIYCGSPPDPSDILTRWNLDPVLLAGLALFVVGIWVGRSQLRGPRSGLVAIAVLAVAFVSPLCALSSALFSARVVHHMLLVLVAAPLLAAAFAPPRKGSLATPLALSSIVLWAWHTPGAYNLALSNVGIYWLMQCSLLGSFLWFWRALEVPDRSLIESATAIIASFAQMGLLGALLTFAPVQLYAIHAIAPLAWGFAPLADQQLGGLLMWVPAGLPYAVMLWRAGRHTWHGMLEQTT